MSGNLQSRPGFSRAFADWKSHISVCDHCSEVNSMLAFRVMMGGDQLQGEQQDAVLRCLCKAGLGIITNGLRDVVTAQDEVRC